MPRIYTPQELELLLSEVDLGTPLSELEVKLVGRSATSIVIKLKKLSEQDSTIWQRHKVTNYINEHMAGVVQKYRENWRQEIRDYLTNHPKATGGDLRKAGLHGKLRSAYDCNLTNARRDAGLHIPDKEERGEESRNRVLSYLKEHPNARYTDLEEVGLLTDFNFVYKGKGNIMSARRDAGIVPTDYISAAEAARELDVSRERVSQLFEKGQLDGYKLGRSVYISLSSVENRKQDTPTYNR